MAKEPETAEGAEKTEAIVPAAADAESYGNPEPAGCSHVCSAEAGCMTEQTVCVYETGERDKSFGYTAAIESFCNFVCSLCPIQARVDALPGPEEINAMDEAAQAEVQKEISSLYEIIAELDEDSKNSLDLSKLTAIYASAVEGKKLIDVGSAILKGWNWMIAKESDTHFILRVPGVTEGTPLPLENKAHSAQSFKGIFGGLEFSVTVDGANILAGQNVSKLNNWNAYETTSIIDAAQKNNGNVPPGTYDMIIDLTDLGGAITGSEAGIKHWNEVSFADGSTAFTLTVVLGPESGDDSQFTPYTIQTVSPSNVNFTLFDYWVDQQTSHDHPDDGRKNIRVIPTCSNPACIGEHEKVKAHAESFYSSGINQGHAVVFGPNGHREDRNEVLGDWNSPTGAGGASLGIVAKQLNDDGYPVLDLDQDEINTKDLVKGRNAKESLEYLFSLEESDSKAVYPNANGLLKIDPDTGNYMYSSYENFASYFEEENTFKVYEKPAVVGGGSETGQFFPFNKPSQVFTIDDTNGFQEKVMKDAEGNTVDKKGNPYRPDGGQDAFFNHYFGMTMEVVFQQQPKGKISNAANAKDMVFKFTGDDDVWIFIDDVLVADLGGIHAALSVEINFATGGIVIDRKDQFSNTQSKTRVTSTIKKQFEEALGENNFNAADFKGDTFADNTVHELKMFYMERGNFASNLEFSFNLVEPRFSHIAKVDQKGDPLGRVEFELYEANTDFKVAEDADAIATLTTRENGSVDLVTYDGEGKPIPIVFEPDKNYVLREVKTLDGFVTTGDIHLEYDENVGMLQVHNQWENGATAGFEALITQTANMKYPDGGDASMEGQEGLILAVPLFNPIHKGGGATQGWRPLYGSVTNGFHMVEVDTEDKEGYQKAVLAAALRQLEDPKNEHWHLEYNQELMRFEGLLRDLPGSADRYVFVNPTDGDMLTAYYLLTPTDGTFDGCTTAEEKHSALAKKLDTMTEEEQKQYFYEQKENMKRLDISHFKRQFYTRLYIPNQVRELRVHKQDEEGKPLTGGEFTLYSDEACQNAVAKGITDAYGNMSFSAQNTGKNGVNGGELSSEVYFPLSRDDTDGGRKATSYWLKETAAPAGFILNESVSEIRVTDDGIYANAGGPDNGVSVRKGVGHLIQTMVRYAADDKLNVTLRDILATKHIYQNVPGEKLPDFSEWGPAADEEPLSLHYGLETKLLDYGLHDDIDRKPYFVTDEGWMGFGVKQNYEAHKDDGTEWATAGGIKEDIRDKDISALLTGTTTVIVTDKEEPPPPEKDTGNLKVSKIVSGRDGDTSQKFTFTVALTDGGNAPVTGTYSYTGSSIEHVTAPVSGSLTFGADGKASFELSHGQSITISGLPAGTNYSAAESNHDGYTVTATNGTVGTIQKDATSEVTFENRKDNGGDGGDDSVDVTVRKVWKLDDGGTAAESVTAALLKDGQQYDAKVLNSQNGWEHTWYNLSDSHTWTVIEQDVPVGFTMSVEQSGYTFTITNDDVDQTIPPDPTDPSDPSNPTDPTKPDEPKADTLQTGDNSNLLLWIALLGVTGSGIITTLIFGKKKKYRPMRSK